MKKSLCASLLLAVAMLLSLSSGALTGEGEVISVGMSYSLLTPASEAYPDDGVKLTDGKNGVKAQDATAFYNSGAYVGFNQAAVDEEGNFVIVIDLGKRYEDLSAFSIGYLNETDIGIYAPKQVTFAVSDVRNGAYSTVGSVDTEKQKTAGISETHISTLAADGAAGRYVMVTVTHLGSFTNDAGTQTSAGWTFIDEISVYSGTVSDGTSSEDSSESQAVSDPPNTGDAGMLAYILLAVSAIVMLAALFTFRKRSKFD